MKKFVVLFFLFIANAFFSQNADTMYVAITKRNSISDVLQFQNAFKNTKGTNLKITVKSGIYNVNTSIATSRSNTTLIFEKGAILNFTSNLSSGFVVLHDYFTLKNTYIKGNGISSKDFYSGYAVLLSGVEYCSITGNTFDSISGNNIMFYPSAKDRGSSFNTISNNQFINPAFNISANGDESAIMMGYSGKNYMHNNNVIEGNMIDGKDQLKNGIGFIGHGNDNVFRNNTISNCLAYGIIAYESQVVGTTINKTQIINNIIKNIGAVGSKKTVKGMGIYLMTANNSLISGNKLYNTLRNSDRTETLGAGAISVSLSPNCTIENNLIDGSNMYGIVSDYSFGSKFLNNTIQNTTKSGAYFINMNDVTVSRNTFKNIGEAVIKGYFEHTSKPYIVEQLRGEKYKNINTGNNFVISNNKIYSDKEILYFIGTNPDSATKYKGNMMSNNVIKDNEVFGNQKNQSELVILSQKQKTNNTIKNNTIQKNNK